MWVQSENTDKGGVGGWEESDVNCGKVNKTNSSALLA